MQYQRKSKVNENQQKERPQEIQNIKKSIRNTKIVKASNEQNPQKIKTKPITVNTISNEKKKIKKK